MGKEEFPRRAKAAGPKGLLERAAEVFDFDKSLRGENLPPLEIAPELLRQPPPAPTQDEGQPNHSGSQRQDRLQHALDWTGPVQKLDRAALAEAGYLVPGAPVSGLGEEFRIIKRELIISMRGGQQREALPNGNVILVTSTHPGDGKTYCAVNLAVSLAAESDMEVLLVDADFAKPGIPAALGLEPGKGLMDALSDPALAIEDMVIRTDVPTLAVLPAGESSFNDAEYLASARMDAVIASLVAGRPNRVVIFDSPPLLAASAAAVLAAHVGQTVLVVRADRTTETALRDAAGLLGGCAHIRLLLNGVKFSASGRRFGTYYGKEGKS